MDKIGKCKKKHGFEERTKIFGEKMMTNLLLLLICGTITPSLSIVAPFRFRRSSLGANPCSAVPTQDEAVCSARSNTKTFGNCHMCPPGSFDDRNAEAPRETRNMCCAKPAEHCIVIPEVKLVGDPTSFGLPAPVVASELVWKGRDEKHQADWQQRADLSSYTITAPTSFLHVSATSKKDSILANGLQVSVAGSAGGADQTHWAKNCEGYVYLWPMSQALATIPSSPDELSEAQVSLFRNKVNDVKKTFNIREKCSIFKVTLPANSVLKSDPDLANAVRFQGDITSEKVSLAWEQP